ncbi:MAG: sensor histidine kinase, partial [Polyangiales bacterium]
MHNLNAWCIAYALMGLGLALAHPERSPALRRFAVFAQSIAIVAMTAMEPCRFSSLPLVLVASQAAAILDGIGMVAFIAVATCSVGPLVFRDLTPLDALTWFFALLGLQSFAAVTVHVARKESLAREALSKTNAELLATRSQLAARTREHERLRIARDLHDVLGHDLTALQLQLEVARNVVTDAQARDHVDRAREVSTRLLNDVRAVVGAIRARPALDLAEAVRTMAEGMPNLAVHLDCDPALEVEDDDRRECLLRCVQEIVTNTARHAGANNLWIALRDDQGTIEVEARDDGSMREPLRPGAGLSGMRERLEELGGSLLLEDAPTSPLRVRA